MDKEIKEYQILIQGKANLEGSLDDVDEDQDVKVYATLELNEASRRSNKDGTINKIYKFKLLSIDKIEK